VELSVKYIVKSFAVLWQHVFQAVVCVSSALFIIHCEITLHVSGAFCTHYQEHIKAVDAIIGTVHVSVWCGLNLLKDVQGRESISPQ
jgi:hypothetical protein